MTPRFHAHFTHGWARARARARTTHAHAARTHQHGHRRRTHGRTLAQARACMGTHGHAWARTARARTGRHRYARDGTGTHGTAWARTGHHGHAQARTSTHGHISVLLDFRHCCFLATAWHHPRVVLWNNMLAESTWRFWFAFLRFCGGCVPLSPVLHFD